MSQVMKTASIDQVETSLAAVSAPLREKNHTVLQPILSDLIVYSLNLKQLHWNIVGAGFRSVHLHLDEIYAETLTAIDTVAERLSAVGHSPNGRSRDVAKEAELKDVPEGFTHVEEVLLLASQRTRELVGLIRDRMDTIEEVDTVTADMLHQIVAGLEKHHWMLQAQRI